MLDHVAGNRCKFRQQARNMQSRIRSKHIDIRYQNGRMENCCSIFISIRECTVTL